MTSTFFWGAITTLWLGILATISPCPLASNIAAVSIITGGGGKTPQNAFITAASYGLGRMVTHGFLGILILKGLVSAPSLAVKLQAAPARLAGPFFIIVGIILLEWLEVKLPGGLKKKILAKRPSGPLGTFAVGCAFSLIPCPETAALFFGGMIPLAVQESSLVLYPALFGAGTALPVMAIGITLSLGVNQLANQLGKIRSIEPILRNITGYSFLGIGIFLTLDNIYNLI